MSCKKDRKLQAAIALGLLWGMGQAAGKPQTLAERADRLRVLLAYTQIHLPVELKDSQCIQVGQAQITPHGQGWQVIDASGTNDYPSFGDAVKGAVIQQVLAAGLPLAPELEEPLTKETVSRWVGQWQNALTSEGGPLEGAALELSYNSLLGSHGSLQAKVYSDHDDKSTIGFGFTVHGPLGAGKKKLLEDLTSSLLNHGRWLEPALGVFEGEEFTENLLNNGYFQVAYVDGATADVLGGQTQSGWYLVRDGQPYKGPMSSPKEAAQWAAQAWGSDVAQYAAVAGLNDQYVPLHRNYQHEIAKINQGPLSEKAKRAALKQLEEQFEFSLRNLVAPYVATDQEYGDFKPPARWVELHGPAGEQYCIQILPPQKKNYSLKWWIFKHEAGQEEGKPKLVTHGYGNHKETVTSEEYNTTYQALFHLVRKLLAQGQIPAVPK